MKRLLVLLALLLLLRCSDGSGSSDGVASQLTLAGKTLQTLAFYKGVDRSRVPNALISLADDRAAIVGYEADHHFARLADGFLGAVGLRIFSTNKIVAAGHPFLCGDLSVHDPVKQVSK